MKTKNETSEMIQQLIDKTSEQAWEMHRKLHGEYKSSWDQYADMERLGQFAKTLRKLSEARTALRFANEEFSNGLQDA